MIVVLAPFFEILLFSELDAQFVISTQKYKYAVIFLFFHDNTRLIPKK